jgi:hypothetical protein
MEPGRRLRVLSSSWNECIRRAFAHFLDPVAEPKPVSGWISIIYPGWLPRPDLIGPGLPVIPEILPIRFDCLNRCDGAGGVE